MADRFVDPENNEPTTEITDVLKMIVQRTLDMAADKMEKGEDLVPFTALVAGEDIFLEQHDAPTPEEIYAKARREVQGARGASAYALCYDGYLELEDGVKDAIVAEAGLPGESEAYAFGYIYDDEGIEREVVYIGPAPNFMEALKGEPAAEPPIMNAVSSLHSDAPLAEWEIAAEEALKAADEAKAAEEAEE